MSTIPTGHLHRKAVAMSITVRFLVTLASTTLLISCATVSEPTVLSDYFAIKKVSGGVGAYQWENNEIYARLSGNNLKYIGTTTGGPPRGMGFLGDATQDLRATTMAISKDGRSIVFRHKAGSGRGSSSLESGIYQYVYSDRIKLIHRENELSGESYSRWDKALPPDLLPFRYKDTYTPKDFLWALKATGENFPLALLDASPLHWAAFEGRTDDGVALIKNGADIDAKTYWDFTPLDLAIIRDHQDMAIQLLTLGANQNSGIYPAFHRAVMLYRMKVVRNMLDRDVDVNATDGWGYTSLHLAVFAGSRMVGGLRRFFDNTETPRSIMEKHMTTKLVQLLLDSGADPNIRDKYGKTPLDVISSITPTEVRELLSDRARVR